MPILTGTKASLSNYKIVVIFIFNESLVADTGKGGGVDSLLFTGNRHAYMYHEHVNSKSATFKL